jgi:hypothetical protein
LPTVDVSTGPEPRSLSGRGAAPATRPRAGPQHRTAPPPMRGRAPGRAHSRPDRCTRTKPKPRVPSRRLASSDPRRLRDDRRRLARTSQAIRFPAPPLCSETLRVSSLSLVIASPVLRKASVQARSIPGAALVGSHGCGMEPKPKPKLGGPFLVDGEKRRRQRGEDFAEAGAEVLGLADVALGGRERGVAGVLFDLQRVVAADGLPG